MAGDESSEWLVERVVGGGGAIAGDCRCPLKRPVAGGIHIRCVYAPLKNGAAPHSHSGKASIIYSTAKLLTVLLCIEMDFQPG